MQGEVEAKLAQDFLKLVTLAIEPHLLSHEGRLSHYEDLYSAAQQILQDETTEVTNPVIGKFVEAIKASSAFLHLNYESSVDGNRFATLVQHSTILIQSVVCHRLTDGVKLAGLELISEMAKATGSLDIISLNHDLLIEEELKRTGTTYTDGFNTPQVGMTQFSGAWEESLATVRLYKLHGSINWHLIREVDLDMVCRIDTTLSDCRNRDGQRINPLTTTPLFLTGTGVKEQEYGVSLFGDIFFGLHECLKRHHTLICCGYGWSDKGINIRLEQWLRNERRNKVVILHNDPNVELSELKFWRNRWDRFIKAGKIEVIPKWLTECMVGDLETLIKD
jgi:hypothetical protein